MSASSGLGFGTRFDAALARRGPPAWFTVDAGGELRLAPNRTRDAWDRLPPEAGSGALPLEWCHCLVGDRATGWVQYVLVTAPGLCREHPRAVIQRFETQRAALEALSALGPVPVERPAAG